MAESRELPLYNINSAPSPFLGAQMPLSNWLAVPRFLLSPGQGGQGMVLLILWRDDLLFDSLDKQGQHIQFCHPSLFPSACHSPLNFKHGISTPLMTSSLLLQSHSC